MTIAEWTSIGGWYGALISTYLAGVLLFTKPTYEPDNSRDRLEMMHYVVLFGWIPAGVVVLALQSIFK